jgi:hypothetical protein
MRNDTSQNGRTFEAIGIGDEAVYLRIDQLQKGLLQFTDSTNAERLVREYNADIRYIAPWKKWMVLGVLLCKTPRRKCVEFAPCANSQAKKL